MNFELAIKNAEMNPLTKLNVISRYDFFSRPIKLCGNGWLKGWIERLNFMWAFVKERKIQIEIINNFLEKCFEIFGICYIVCLRTL